MKNQGVYNHGKKNKIKDNDQNKNSMNQQKNDEDIVGDFTVKKFNNPNRIKEHSYLINELSKIGTLT